MVWVGAAGSVGAAGLVGLVLAKIELISDPVQLNVIQLIVESDLRAFDNQRSRDAIAGCNRIDPTAKKLPSRIIDPKVR